MPNNAFGANHMRRLGKYQRRVLDGMYDNAVSFERHGMDPLEASVTRFELYTSRTSLLHLATHEADAVMERLALRGIIRRTQVGWALAKPTFDYLNETPRGQRYR